MGLGKPQAVSVALMNCKRMQLACLFIRANHPDLTKTPHAPAANIYQLNIKDATALSDWY